jgi:hypothetical protein
VSNLVLLTLGADGGAVPWTGEGRAQVFTGPHQEPATWFRSDGEPPALVDAEGMTAALRPGMTWIVLVPPGARLGIINH